MSFLLPAFSQPLQLSSSWKKSHIKGYAQRPNFISSTNLLRGFVTFYSFFSRIRCMCNEYVHTTWHRLGGRSWFGATSYSEHICFNLLRGYLKAQRVKAKGFSGGKCQSSVRHGGTSSLAAPGYQQTFEGFIACPPR